MAARPLAPDVLFIVFVGCCSLFSTVPAFALGPVVSQTAPGGQVVNRASIPEATHAADSRVGSASTGKPARDTLVIPEQYQTIRDPLAPVNEKSFKVNETIDQHAFHPIANLWSSAVPRPAQDCITRFFDNSEVIPRFANAVFQLRFKWAGGELARFGINSTLGVAGLFDPA